MKKTDRAQVISFSKPIRQIVTMIFACGLVGAGIWFIHVEVLQILRTSFWLNAFILGVFLFGVLTCFWQVFILMQSVSWIEDFVNETPGTYEARPPRLLAPLASLLRSRDSRMAISSSSANSILDSVATRIDEARDITRYLTNLLIFLGLLGTFYGLATTIPAIVETIR
ncbi:MAG: biopolymer transporter ExbB, partial [Candidatus Saccharibacteria bacterium]|nr:biopolymer transporter ExbB [Pseudorhodobacter sp.]